MKKILVLLVILFCGMFENVSAQCGQYFKDKYIFIGNYYSSSVCPGAPIVCKIFQHTPTNDVVWDFGNGGGETTPYYSFWVTPTYTDTGSYVVSAYLIDDCGNDTTITKTVTVRQTTHFDTPVYISDKNKVSCPDQNVYVNISNGSDRVDSALWTVSNGVTSSGSYFLEPMPNYGLFNYTVALKDYCGNDTTLSGTINIQTNGVFDSGIYLDKSLDTVCPGKLAYINVEGGAKSAVWTFNDGSSLDSLRGVWQTDSAGVFPYSVVVSDFCGNESTFHDSVTVGNTPYLLTDYIDQDKTSVCPGEKVMLNSDYGGKSLSWTFSDGVASTADYVIWSNSTLGNYNYAVEIEDYCGNDSTYTGTITVEASGSLASDIALNNYDDSICPGEYGYFTLVGSISKASWTFSDGTSEAGLSIYPAPKADGDYTFSVVVTDDCGNDTTITGVFVVGKNISGFDADMQLKGQKDSICPGESIGAYLSGTNSGGKWVFSDGYSTTGISTGHTVETNGVHSYTLEVEDGCGNDTVFSESFVVGPGGNFDEDIYIINSNKNSFCPGDKINLNVAGSADSILWTFSDGVTSSLKHPRWFNETLGNYSYTVYVKDKCGNDSTFTGTLIIENSGVFDPDLILYPYKDEVCPGMEPMFLTNSSPKEISWVFSDGYTSNNIDPGWSNLVEGIYTYDAVVKDFCGNSSEFSGSVNVKKSNKVDWNFFFDWYSHEVCINSPVQYEGNLKDYAESVRWEFSDGSISNDFEPSPNYFSTAGSHTYTIDIIFNCGSDSTITGPVEVHEANSTHCEAQGTMENEQLRMVYASPNPTEDEIKFDLGLFTGAEVTIVVHDVQGQLLLTEKTQHSKPKISFGEFGLGVYFVSFSSQGARKTITVMVK